MSKMHNKVLQPKNQQSTVVCIMLRPKSDVITTEWRAGYC